MTPACEALWRPFLARFPACRVYTVDPGADAVVTALMPVWQSLGTCAGWYTEGWSAARRPENLPAASLFDDLQPGETLFLGSQTDFARTQRVLERATERGARSVFLFDHWKNYAAHFEGGTLPDIVVLPDEIARAGLEAALGTRRPKEITVLPHAGIDAAAERIRALVSTAAQPIIALLLDPTELTDGLGYDWRDALAGALATLSTRKGLALRVRPHPRQSPERVAAAIAARRGHVDAALYPGDTDHLIAEAQEVWGMTSVALNIALAAGKPIRSFQIGRTEEGRLASNPHIEPFTITRSDAISAP